ncbi:hypothetical protein Acr_21g0004780 [Actinidia rufa]|uniref:Tf2-1-like SH3-like domain-containing protein n=1 Tax=Actinidia rufa TaxID=165716 RepID=A0A7J0GGE3_9ERIC|nr:hypothetical protein Acr_21g0004780 [Actinidia rufa]
MVSEPNLNPTPSVVILRLSDFRRESEVHRRPLLEFPDTQQRRPASIGHLQIRLKSESAPNLDFTTPLESNQQNEASESNTEGSERSRALTRYPSKFALDLLAYTRLTRFERKTASDLTHPTLHASTRSRHRATSAYASVGSCNIDTGTTLIQFSEADACSADSRRRHSEFQVGDYGMVRFRPERYPSNTARKLCARSAGPFKVLKRIGTNAYVIDLPPDSGISSTFNIEDLVAFKGNFDIPTDLFFKPIHEPTIDQPTTSNIAPTPLPISPIPKEHIDVLDEQIISTRDGGVQRILVRWRDRPASDDTWITSDDLQQIDRDMFEYYQSCPISHSTESSFLRPRRIGGDTGSRPTISRVYSRRSKKAYPVSLWLNSGLPTGPDA